MKWKAAIVPLVLLAAFFSLAWTFGRASDPPAFDLYLFRAVSRFRSPAMTKLLAFVTELGRTSVALMWVAVAWRQSRNIATHLAAATIGGWFISETAKLLIARPRPIEILPLVDVYGSSFPSGHAVVAAATYTTAAILVCRGLQRPGLRALVWAAASLTIALVAASRVYLGAHYGSDVVGGLLLGTAWAAVLAQRWYHGRNFLRKDSGHEVHDYNARD